MRDGFTHFDEEAEVQAFDDVLFPLALGREAEVAPGFATAIVTSAGGHERRNASWAEARTRYDVGPGVRSEEHTSELQSLMRISYAVFCLKQKKTTIYRRHMHNIQQKYIKNE